MDILFSRPGMLRLRLVKSVQRRHKVMMKMAEGEKEAKEKRAKRERKERKEKRRKSKCLFFGVTSLIICWNSDRIYLHYMPMNFWWFNFFFIYNHIISFLFWWCYFVIYIFIILLLYIFRNFKLNIKRLFLCIAYLVDLFYFNEMW